MPKKGSRKSNGTLSEKELETLKKANEASRSPEAKKKRAASLAITNAIKNELGFSGRLTPLVENYLRQILCTPNSKGKTYLNEFIDNFLKQAKDDPGSKCGQLLASSIFSAELLSKLDEQANKEMQKDIAFLNYRIRDTLYDKQQEVFDNKIDQNVLIICTRRAGKSEMDARILLSRALSKPEFHVLYLNRSFDNALGQMGAPLDKLLKQFNIKYDGALGGGKITLENGSTITFGGYNNKGDIDRYRGFKFGLVIVDEISHLRNPENLLKEVLEPAMIDYGKDAQLFMTGTPPRTKTSYAYKVWHNPNYKKYTWSFMDNPFIPAKEDVIENACKKHGVTPDAPFIRREYYGDMEAFDVDALVFRGYQTIANIPNKVVTNCYIGVDFGFEDAAAVVSVIVIDKVAYVVDQWSEAHKPVSDLCNEVKRQYDNLKSKYQLAKDPWVITDTNNKESAYELQMTYKIPNVFCAYKYDRDMAIEQLAEFMRTGKILIQDKGILKEEAENTIWARDEETDEIIHELSDEYHPNALFALLYLSRQYAVDVLGITDTNKDVKRILNESN